MIVRPAAKVRNRQTTWYVQSETEPGTYYIIHYKRDITTHRPKWTCNCLDFTERRQFNGTNCKHVREVQNYNLQQEAAAVNANPSTRQVIDYLVAALNGPNGKEVWDVVSALRGPDNDDMSLKDATTAAIRGAIGMVAHHVVVTHATPLALAEFLPLRNNAYAATPTVKQVVWKSYPSAQGHFLSHYAMALQTLVKLGYIKA